MSSVFRQMTGSGSKGSNDTRTPVVTGKARPARLLYVDDSRTSAYVVKRMLKPYGYHVDHYESAEPALIALIEQDYDLLLTDLKVSPKGMDGDDLVRALRASGSKKVSSMPIIVITGATDTGVLSQVYDAGANQIMTKPVNGEELDAHIRKLVFAGADPTSTSAATNDGLIVSLGQDAKNKINVPATGGHADDARRMLGKSTLPPVPHPDLSPQSDGVPVPRPAVNVKPAARVIPTINKPVSVSASAALNTSTAEKNRPVTSAKANTALNTTTARQVANKSAAVKKSPAPQKTAATSGARAPVNAIKQPAGNAAVAKAKLNTGAVKTKKPVDPEVLKRVKAAAAAKKAKLIAQHKAKLRAAQAKKASSPPLGLEPKENEAVEVYHQQQTSSHQASPSNPAAQASVNIADAARQAATSDTRPQASVHTSELFGQQQSDPNILQQMERFPLVQTNLRGGRSASGAFSFLSSVFELWGPKKLLLMIATVGVIAFAFNFWGGFLSDGLKVSTTSVEQGEIFQSITVPGKVVSKLRVDLTPSIAGRLTNVYVEEGDKVKKGELLARLDDREAKINLKRSETNLDNAKEDVALAERSLKRLRQAFSKGAVARQLVEDAEVELRSARARDSVAQEEVRTAKLSLENPRIVAPFGGTITARYVEVGQWVVPSETLFTLVDQSQREIEVQVDAADSGGIAVGQTVSLSSDAFPGLNWPESVTRLAAATSNVGNANIVSVYVSMGSKAPSLRFGQQVDAEIRTAWNPSALKVPYGSIINRDGKSFVAVVEDNFVSLVEVETGIEDFSHVEIRQGVSVGQSVILANGIDIDEGDRVVISSSN